MQGNSGKGEIIVRTDSHIEVHVKADLGHVGRAIGLMNSSPVHVAL